MRRNPFVLILFGAIQWRLWRLWPDVGIKPFPCYEIPKTPDNPNGVIMAQSYGYFIHEYIYWVCLWIFCALSTPWRGQFLVMVFIEIMDIADFILRYNTPFMMVFGWDLEYTDLKLLFYTIIAISTWTRSYYTLEFRYSDGWR